MQKAIVLAVLVLATIGFGQWEPDVRLSQTPTPSEIPMSGRGIAASGDAVHVVWEEGWDPWDHEFPEIYCARSTDAGVSWEPQHRLTVDSALSGNPCVDAASPFVYVAWQDLRVVPVGIFVKRSTDDGATWSVDGQVPGATGSDPIIRAGDSVLHLVYHDRRAGLNLVYYRRSTDRGLTWMPEQQLSDTGSAYAPAVAVSGGRVHVAWYDYRKSNAEVYYRGSGDRGITWGPEERLTDDSLVSLEPFIDSDGQDVHVIWKEYRLGGGWVQRILYRRSTDAGETWSDQARLTPDTIDAYYFSLAVSGPDVHLAWMGHPTSNRESHIYYARSRDRGQDWEPHACLTDSVSDYAIMPSLAVSGPAVHVAWGERRDTISYEEVYYRRDPTGNAALSEERAESGSARLRREGGRTGGTVLRAPELARMDCRVLDIQGRDVTGRRDRLCPGIYFVRREQDNTMTKVVIQR